MDFNNKDYELEKRSSAVSLSDMEIFVFPEIMYSLVLANIMSPKIWRWLDDPWFKDIESYKPYKRIQRLRQYIMDNYVFNLDLDTWGLTTKDKELKRFSNFIDMDVLAQSNALFGYEGDKYYFDIEIRKHFGLDKYTSDVIPYWKTETVEAMDAFKFKAGYTTGAGECVSLSSLWAAALFVICKIPLEHIFMMATPLHSQNYVMERDGILTNNRRIVTKSMWVNGTELSSKARRAMDNEKIIVVSHISGYIHIMYEEGTIDPAAYSKLNEELNTFLTFNITPDLICNFLRSRDDFQKCVELKRIINGKEYFIGLDRVFAYEKSSNFLMNEPTRRKLLDEIESEEFTCFKHECKILLNDIEEYLTQHPIKVETELEEQQFKDIVDGCCLGHRDFSDALVKFAHSKPDLPDIASKTIKPYTEMLHITTDMSREEITSYLKSMRDKNPMAFYAFYALRDLMTTESKPFIVTAVQRNPVCIEALKGNTIDEIIQILHGLPDDSIYEENFRLAQPDEVWNAQRGGGLEKAILLATVIKHLHKNDKIEIINQGKQTIVKSGLVQAVFPNSKVIKEEVIVIE